MVEHAPLPLRILERFTLRAAANAARSSSEPARAALAEGVKRARARAEAADALFADGHRAEALRLLSEALDATLALVDEPHHANLLAHRGLALPSIRALSRELRAIPAGVVDEPRWFRALAARRRLDDALTLAASTEAGLRRKRATRVAAAILALTAPVVIALVPLPELPRVRLTASGQWAFDAHFPRHAVDGDPDTEWQTPNHQPGWIDLRIAPPADLTRVRLLNGHNGRFRDRACAQVVVNIYRRGELLESLDGRWASIGDEPAWLELPVEAQGVDRIRVEVLSHHGVGAALAEIEWE